MKKIIYSLFLCLLIGCTQSNNGEIKVEQGKLVSSDIYKHPSSPTLLTSEEFYPLRLRAIQEGELEKAVFVRHVDESNVGKEVTVTDCDELMKLSEFFKGISLTGETRGYGPLGKVTDFEVTIKGKTPIYLRISDEALISNGNCLLLHSEKKLYDTLDCIEGNTREVYAPNLDVAFVNNENWTDVKIVEPPFDDGKDENRVVEALWKNYDDPLKNVLRLASFIDEEFDNWQDIEDQKQLVAGLIQQTPIRYNCFETPENVCKFRKNEMLYFPNGKPTDGFVYSLMPSKNVEQTGKRIFEENYRLPELEKGRLFSQNYQFYNWLADEHLFVYHLPYEVMFPELESMYILNEETVEDEIRAVLLKYRNEFRMSEKLGHPVSILIGLDGYEIALEDHEGEDVETILESNQEHFEQWEYVLRKTDTGYQMVSGKYYNDMHFINEVDSSKDIIYRDQDNVPQVNLASEDAYHFNQWVKNQKVPTKYKENIHEGLLTIWVKGNHNFAVVFDVETGKTLSQEEIIERLNIDKAKLIEALKKVDGYENVIEEYAFERTNPIDYFMTSNLFIDSKGNPALSIYEDVILFDWGEVR